MLVLAILVAAAVSTLPTAQRKRVVAGFETASQIIFRVIRFIMYLARSGPSAAWPTPSRSSAGSRSATSRSC